MMTTNKIKKNIRKRLLFSGVFVMAMMFIMISVSFSWLNNNPYGKVSNIQIESVNANNLLVRKEDSDVWSKVIAIEFDEDFRMKPVSGNGIHFYNPVLEQTDDSNDFAPVRYEHISGSLKENGIYEVTFSCMVENSLSVFLDKGSSLTAAENSDMSEYGDFSAGNICAAMRVAILQQEGDSYILRGVWIPNATTELDTATGTSLKVGNGTVEDSYVFMTGANGSDRTVVETNGKASGSKTINNVTYAWGDLEESFEIGSIEGDTEKSFKVVIWIDGDDRECHNALLDGLVSVNLKIMVDEAKKGE